MDVAESERSFEDIEYSRTAGSEGVEEDLFQSVDELQNHGVGAADIQKLKLAGICTIKVRFIPSSNDRLCMCIIKGVNMTSKRCLAKVKGLSEAKVDKIKEAAAKMQVWTSSCSHHFVCSS